MNKSVMKQLSKYEEIIGRENATCEEICINFAKHINISPLARLLFNLRINSKSGNNYNNFVPFNELLDPKQKYEFRFRFVVLKPTVNLIKLDIVTYKYYYNQVKYDLVHGKIADIKYPADKDKILGLGAVMMYIDYLELKCSMDDLKNNYKKYIPKQLTRNHVYFAKNSILKALNEVLLTKYEIDYVLKIYFDAVHELAPNYLVEEYECMAACLEEDNLNQKMCPIIVQVNQFHDTQPGIRVYYKYRNEWKHIAKLEEIYLVHCDDEKRSIKLELAGQVKGFTLIFPVSNNTSSTDLASFATCVAGYYRLSVKWMQDICIRYPTPSLELLKSLKCNGPIGADFSYARIRKINFKPGTYILRQCEKEYEVYKLDIIIKGTKIETFHIKHLGDKWHLFFGESNNGGSQEFDRISDIIHSIETDGEKFCIPPSEYDKASLLLVCSHEKQLKIKQFVADLRDVDLQIMRPQIIDPCSDLQWYVDSRTNIDYGRIIQLSADWIIPPGDKRLKVTLKMCRHESDNSEFLNLSAMWGKINVPEFIKLHGISISKPHMMVLEHSEFGNLQSLLQDNKLIHFKCLVEAIYSLVRAVVYMQERNIIHHKIRCNNLFVTKFNIDSNILVAKLGDSGLPRPYDIEDFPWIPIEYDGKLENAKNDPIAQHWAFATTVWEIFSHGINLEDEHIATMRAKYFDTKLILCLKDNWPTEIQDIIRDGWSPNRENRFSSQLIFSRLANIRMCEYDVYIDCVSSSTSMMTDLSESCSSHNSFGNSFCNENSSLSQTSHDSYIDDLLNDIGYVIKLDYGKDIVGKKIGEGHYGTVKKGEIQYNDSSREPCQVAIKTLKHWSNSSTERNDFKREIEIMKQLKHKNIVQIITYIESPEILIIMEYIECGSFTVYLNSEKRNLTNMKLLKFALDIAEGMHYLRGKHIIHRDLAARNILVDNSCAKLSDFGLARVADADGFYRIQTNEREIPVKWYSPETLQTNKFSFQSDVWSYGVTLFEMFSRGETPHLIPGQEIETTELLNRLNQGERLRKPTVCPTDIYHKLMLPCWHADPSARPSFDQIINTIRDISTSFATSGNDIY